MFRLMALVAAALTVIAAHGAEQPDTLAPAPREKVSNTLWIKQLLQNGFKIHDPDVAYPRFPRFALKVYDWGNNTFNTYDTTYVIGTGCNWKVQAKSYNWMETSAILKEEKALSMHSLPYCDAGFSLSFMAVSVGYMWDMNQLFRHPNKRQTFNFDFTTSRFNFSVMSAKSTGNMIIDRFGDYGKETHQHTHLKFDDVSFNYRHIGLLYFLNHNYYSHAAGYTYSKYQLKTAGTWLVGASFNEESVSMDFGSLPAEILQYNPLETTSYSSHFRDYGVMGGYARNIVLRPRRWTFNFTATASVGYRRSLNTDREGRRDLRSRIGNRVRFDAALVYNHRALFSGLTFKSWALSDYNSKMYNLNGFVSLQLNVGMRF